jgi:hypothetical protein
MLSGSHENLTVGKAKGSGRITLLPPPLTPWMPSPSFHTRWWSNSPPHPEAMLFQNGDRGVCGSPGRAPPPRRRRPARPPKREHPRVKTMNPPAWPGSALPSFRPPNACRERCPSRQTPGLPVKMGENTSHGGAHAGARRPLPSGRPRSAGGHALRAIRGTARLRGRLAGRIPAGPRRHRPHGRLRRRHRTDQSGLRSDQQLDPQPGPDRRHLPHPGRPRPQPHHPRHRRLVGSPGLQGGHQTGEAPQGHARGGHRGARPPGHETRDLPRRVRPSDRRGAGCGVWTPGAPQRSHLHRGHRHADDGAGR